MLLGGVILLISFAYLGILFAIAYIGDKRRKQQQVVTKKGADGYGPGDHGGAPLAPQGHSPQATEKQHQSNQLQGGDAGDPRGEGGQGGPKQYGQQG